MSDYADDASETETKDRDRCIAAARRQVAQPREASNECANDCGNSPRERSAYCSRECRDDAEQRAALQKRQGRA